MDEGGDACVYCRNPANGESLLCMCSVCRATCCAACLSLAVEHRFLRPGDMSTPLLCPCCRTPIIPSFAQVVQTPGMLSTIVNCSAESFWTMVGIPPPPVRVTIHLFAAYVHMASVLNTMRTRSRHFIERLRALRRTPQRAAAVACHVDDVYAWESAFAAIPGWGVSS